MVRTTWGGVIRFLPAMMVLPVWLTIALREKVLLDSFRSYYPLSVAMIFGSMIAGSTPLGGGVVAFPISVLVIGFSPSQGRDFSLMIQSIGMTSASFLIVMNKPTLLVKYGELLAKTVLFNLVGLIAGMFWTISPFAVMCLYTTAVAAFALILAYVETCLHHNISGMPPKEQLTRTSFDMSVDDDRGDMEIQTKDTLVEEKSNHSNLSICCDTTGMVLLGILGGLISSQIGTGADITWFAYGSLVYNYRMGCIDRMNGNELTASSIIVMTTTSIFGSILRATSTGSDAPTIEVYQALISCACIVVLGAPLGSLFLSAEYERRLKGLFYILSFVQLATFGIIKIRDNVLAWIIVSGVLGWILVVIAIADWFIFQTESGLRRLVAASHNRDK
ncbi:unnamed protein product [Cylindrotheca closterium]|uniref:Membrane transporter protein n=1 Tax=Cylindrotheca closterium TaxID=2856 RepID=A0AAD2FSJ8_9STRA|nr:unnamed protein product [Cylindrotheca closterium]